MEPQPSNIRDANTLLKRLRQNPDLKLVMIASHAAYTAKRIPNSLLLCHVDDAEILLNKEDDIVVYSSGLPYLSHWLCAYLKEQGFCKVQFYKGGLEDWEAAGYELAGVWAKKAA